MRLLARHPIKSFFRTTKSKMASTSLERSILFCFFPLNLYVFKECCGKGLNSCCSELSSQDGANDHTSQTTGVNVSALSY